MERTTTFVLGGCRSGKSRIAMSLAETTAASNRIFIATCLPQDDEMKERVRRHQQERGPRWETLEVPLCLTAAVRENSRAENVLLIDCITLWISNLLMEKETEETVLDLLQKLSEALAAAACPVILVSNEVGLGIVPDNRLARTFRDLAGTANQILAAASDRVVWMVAGIPVFIKGKATSVS